MDETRFFSGDNSGSIKSPNDLSRQNYRSLLQLELEIRPVLLVEVLVDFFRDVIELLRPTFEDRVGCLVTVATG